MTLVRASSAALLALLVGTGAAWAQATQDPVGRNQTEGQLTPGQAQEVAPSEENMNMDTSPDGPPSTTGSIGSSEAPAGSDDDVPDENRSISGKVQEETEGSTQP